MSQRKAVRPALIRALGIVCLLPAILGFFYEQQARALMLVFLILAALLCGALYLQRKRPEPPQGEANLLQDAGHFDDVGGLLGFDYQEDTTWRAVGGGIIVIHHRVQ